MLIAAAADPERWERLVIMEPTLQDPRIPPLNETNPPSYQRSRINSGRRRVEFPDIDTVIERWKAAPNFERAQPDLFRSYVKAAFAPTEAGTIRLRCHPESEARMIGPIMQVFQRRYRPPTGVDDPFRPLLDLQLPVTLVTTELSGPIYKEMVERGKSMLPNVIAHRHIEAYGHLVPMENPEVVAALMQPQGEV
jgi:pimeloyl-ACP methyl ester carboxylesterase